MKKINPKTSATVTPITSAVVTVEPPEGWKLNGEHGYMGSDTTPAGRLVRLADVVMWLMDRRALPCSVAVEELCTAIEAAAPNALYLVRPGDFALPVTETDCFNAVTIQTIRSFWESEPAQVASDCGLSGALSYMRSIWGGSATPGESDHYGQWVLDPLAIHLNKAAELWGYGHVVQPVAVSVADVDEWTGERLAQKKAEFKRDGKGKFMKRLADLTGLDERNITRRIDAAGLGSPKSPEVVSLETAWGTPGAAAKRKS